jgi:carboxylesterase
VPVSSVALAPGERHVLRSTPGVANDMARKDAPDETGYSRVPLHAADSFRRLLARLDTELPQVTQPLLLLHSRTDHVVPPVDSARVLARVSSTDVTETVLERSYHVATLDYDAERIFADSYAFIARLAPDLVTADGQVPAQAAPERTPADDGGEGTAARGGA